MGPNNTDLKTEQLESFGRGATIYMTEKKLRQRFAKELAEKHDISRNNKPKRIDNSIIMRSAAAVAFLIVAIFGFNKLNSTNSSSLMATNYIEDTYIMGNQQIMRKGKMNENEIRLKANKAYVMKDYHQSIAYYTKLSVLDGQKMSDLDYFYLGISQLKQEVPNAKAAIANFLIVKKNISFSKELNWMLSLAYVVNGDKEKAKDLLNLIANSDGYKNDKAKKLLATLE